MELNEDSVREAMAAADERLKVVGKMVAHDPFDAKNEKGEPINITREVSIACISAYLEAEGTRYRLAYTHPGNA